MIIPNEDMSPLIHYIIQKKSMTFFIKSQKNSNKYLLKLKELLASTTAEEMNLVIEGVFHTKSLIVDLKDKADVLNYICACFGIWDVFQEVYIDFLAETKGVSK